SGIDSVGTLVYASAPVQDIGARRRDHRVRTRHRALRATCHAALWRDHRTDADRLRRRHRLSGCNRLDPERRAGASSRNRDRRHEFLPCTREHARSRDHGCDLVRWPWRHARARAGGRETRWTSFSGARAGRLRFAFAVALAILAGAQPISTVLAEFSTLTLDELREVTLRA